MLEQEEELARFKRLNADWMFDPLQLAYVTSCNNLLANLTASGLPRPKSPECRGAVYVLRVLSPSSPPWPTGTAFAISPSKILTCYHNIADYDSNGIETLRYVDCDLVTELKTSDPAQVGIQVQFVDGNPDLDWAIFERCDGKEFPRVLSICSEPLPHPSTRLNFVVYYAPITLLFVAMKEISVWCETTQLLQYETDAPTATFSGGKTKGCSGAPIVDENGRVLAFLCASPSETGEAFDKTCAAPPSKKATQSQRLDNLEKHSSRSDDQHTSYTSGLVVVKVPDIMRHITP